MTTSRFDHVATLVPGGKVLVAGGVRSSSFLTVLSSAELYDPRTGTWSPTGSMSTERRDATMTLLRSGAVLVTGGDNRLYYAATAELYDPTTASWSPTGSMAVGRVDHTATMLANGQVLVTGGANSMGIETSAELYDPKTGAWRPTGSMLTPRYRDTATLLANCTVLVVGGQNNTTYALASAERYRPPHDVDGEDSIRRCG